MLHVRIRVVHDPQWKGGGSDPGRGTLISSINNTVDLCSLLFKDDSGQTP